MTTTESSIDPTPQAASCLCACRSVHVALLLAAALALTLWGLGDRGLWSAHEGRAARVATTMLETGEWIVPQLSPGEPTYQKPPLYYWLVAGSSWLGGGQVSAFTTRLPSALATVMTVLLVYCLARDLRGHRAGLIAGAALLTCARLMWVSRVAVLDPLLMLWITLALCLFWRAYRRKASWAGFLVVGVPLALGVLTKGPIAMVMPAVIVGVFIAWETVRRRRAAVLWGLVRCLPAVLVCLIIVVPWFVAMDVRTGGDFTLEFFVYHHLCRSGRIELVTEKRPTDIEPSEAAWTDYLDGDRNGYLVYRVLTDRGLDNRQFEAKSTPGHYITRLWGNMFPWSIFLPGALLWLFARRDKANFDQPVGLVVSWLVAGIVLLSLMKFRKSEYLLPMYPALAVLVGVFIDEVLSVREKNRFWDWLLRSAMMGLLAFAVAIGALLLLLLNGGFSRWVQSLMRNTNDQLMFGKMQEQFVAYPVLVVLGATVLVAFFSAALWQWWRGRERVALGLVAGAMAVISLGYAACSVETLDAARSHKALVSELRRSMTADDLVIVACNENHELSYLLHRGGVVWLRHPDGHLWREDERPAEALVRRYDNRIGGGFLITPRRYAPLASHPRLQPICEEPADNKKSLTLLTVKPADRTTD
jgi:4-amino-4-deoxy-L-arabinose transferase-like glycosyltransferase